MTGEYRWHLYSEVLEKQRSELVALAGGKCVVCGSEEELEFHHPFGKNWRSKSVSRSERLRRYKADYEAGECYLSKEMK